MCVHILFLQTSSTINLYQLLWHNIWQPILQRQIRIEKSLKIMSVNEHNGFDKMQTAGDTQPNPSTWSTEKEKIILAPYDYLLEHPGKNMRSRLLFAFNKWLHVPTSRLETIIKVVNMLHTASLLLVQSHLGAALCRRMLTLTCSQCRRYRGFLYSAPWNTCSS